MAHCLLSFGGVVDYLGKGGAVSMQVQGFAESLQQSEIVMIKMCCYGPGYSSLLYFFQMRNAPVKLCCEDSAKPDCIVSLSPHNGSVNFSPPWQLFSGGSKKYSGNWEIALVGEQQTNPCMNSCHS